MSKHLFSEASHLSDAVLIVEGKQLHISKSVLSLASPVFDRMFHGDFKEGKTGEITLPGKQYDHIVEFLSCIYPSSDITITQDNMDIILPLADEYQVSCIKDSCDTLIVSMLKKTTTPELVYFMHIAGQYGLSKSSKESLELASTIRLRDLQSVKDFDRLDPETKYQVEATHIKRYEEVLRDMFIKYNQHSVDCSDGVSDLHFATKYPFYDLYVGENACDCHVKIIRDVLSQNLQSVKDFDRVDPETQYQVASTHIKQYEEVMRDMFIKCNQHKRLCTFTYIEPRNRDLGPVVGLRCDCHVNIIGDAFRQLKNFHSFDF